MGQLTLLVQVLHKCTFLKLLDRPIVRDETLDMMRRTVMGNVEQQVLVRFSGHPRHSPHLRKTQRSSSKPRPDLRQLNQGVRHAQPLTSRDFPLAIRPVSDF